MARKVATVTCALEGRDKGKKFQITEMSAHRAEKWAMRALLAVASADINIPEDVASQGIAVIAQTGLSILGAAKFSEVEPLLDEMLECVKIIRDPARPDLAWPINTHEDADDIEETTTLPWLRGEVLKVHVDFSKLVARLKSPSDEGPPAPTSDPQTSPT